METDERSIREVRQGMAEVVNAAAVRSRVTFITSRGRRVAAVVPLSIAEQAVASDEEQE